jgi:hypothetical protein
LIVGYRLGGFDCEGSVAVVERLRWFAQSVVVLIVVDVLGVVVLVFDVDVLVLGIVPDVVLEVDGVVLEAVVLVPDKLPLVLAVPLVLAAPELGLFRSQFVPRVLEAEPVAEVPVAVVVDVPVAEGELCVAAGAPVMVLCSPKLEVVPMLEVPVVLVPVVGVPVVVVPVVSFDAPGTVLVALGEPVAGVPEVVVVVPVVVCASAIAVLNAMESTQNRFIAAPCGSYGYLFLDGRIRPDVRRHRELLLRQPSSLLLTDRECWMVDRLRGRNRRVSCPASFRAVLS